MTGVLYTGEGEAGVVFYACDATGRLSRRGAATLSAGGNPGPLCVHPNRHFLFVSSSEGTLTPLSGLQPHADLYQQYVCKYTGVWLFREAQAP